jgi:hypothetical protein
MSIWSGHSLQYVVTKWLTLRSCNKWKKISRDFFEKKKFREMNLPWSAAHLLLADGPPYTHVLICEYPVCLVYYSTIFRQFLSGPLFDYIIRLHYLTGQFLSGLLFDYIIWLNYLIPLSDAIICTVAGYGVHDHRICSNNFIQFLPSFIVFTIF